MKRYDEIDILKGIAVICMVVFHLFYFPNQYGFKEFEYDTITLKTVAKIATPAIIAIRVSSIIIQTADANKF